MHLVCFCRFGISPQPRAEDERSAARSSAWNSFQPETQTGRNGLSSSCHRFPQRTDVFRQDYRRFLCGRPAGDSLGWSTDLFAADSEVASAPATRRRTVGAGRNRRAKRWSWRSAIVPLVLLAGVGMAHADAHSGVAFDSLRDEIAREQKCRQHLWSIHGDPATPQSQPLRREIVSFQALVEESLVYREQSIALAKRLQQQIKQRKPLSGADLDLLNRSMAAHMGLREQLYGISPDHIVRRLLIEKDLEVVALYQGGVEAEGPAGETPRNVAHGKSRFRRPAVKRVEASDHCLHDAPVFTASAGFAATSVSIQANVVSRVALPTGLT